MSLHTNKKALNFNKLTIVLLALVWSISVSAQQERKSFEAVRTSEKITIDGVMDEDVWCQAPLVTDFIQNSPNPGMPSQRKSEVRMLYDDQAIYIVAQLYDKKDDVFNLLTNRDNIGNSDYFGVSFDPYNAGLNGVGIFVTVAGVQYDTRYSNGGREDIWRNDSGWNAVWLSAVEISDEYWTVEMKIPYAVLRFSSQDVQNWGINFMRQNTSLNESSYWSPIDPEISGYLNQAGVVKNIKNITPPTRLFFYPYVSTVINRATGIGTSNPRLNGGMDIKYGINDAFTLDMTLIPDFSGVRSDRQVLNLSPFEVKFDENRAFFTEGVELFNKAGLFYSRRIGGTFGNRTRELKGNESVTYSPDAAQLVNASKITGRTNGGLGIGFFNAITKPTYLEVENTDTGEKTEVEADPLTNFNVIVLDQNLKNNSSVTLTNTNVTRAKNGDDANVTAFNFSLNDANRNWRTTGFFGYSNIASYQNGVKDTKAGIKYNIGIDKNRGQFQYGINRNVESDTYDINDLGFLRQSNQIEHRADFSFNQFEPVGIFNNYNIRLNVNHEMLYEPKEFSSWRYSVNTGGQLKNFWYISTEFGGSPGISNDFFESRVAGYVFKKPSSYSGRINLNTDSRKQVRMSGNLRFGRRPDWGQTDQSMNLSARVRIGERAEISHNVEVSSRDNERGYARRLYNDTNGDLEAVIFGRREVRNFTNTLNGSYIFTNRMGVTFRARHYWSRVDYKEFYELTEGDELVGTTYTGIDAQTGEMVDNRNYNAFNIDMEYNWQFAPGSEIRAIWKRSIGTNDYNTQLRFIDNFNSTFGAPNSDSITIRMVYFIDYLNIKNIFTKG
tara:strand:+ start:194874 stop:197384 length:2511 start_codon:yes stop_codon:yes gene_type:complete